MTQKNRKVELRFKNLPYLLKDMEEQKWIIESFSFRYKGEQYFVILTRYEENDSKPSRYAKAKVEFVLSNNVDNSIVGHIDFFNVHFNSAKEFCDFFDVERGNANRDLFKDFSRAFSSFIPEKRVLDKSPIEKKLLGSRVEGNNINAVYCYDVRRNGRKEDGTLKSRTIENSNKAQLLRPELYKRYCSDYNLSFFFSDRQEDDRSNTEIMRVFANRK